MRFYKEFVILFLISISIQVFSKELRKVVAVVDTGIPYNKLVVPYLCKGMQFDVTGKGVADVHGHGSNILGIIAEGMNPKTHCLAMIKWWHSEADHLTPYVLRDRILQAERILATLNPVLVNLSLSGDEYLMEERYIIKELLDKGTKVVVAAGNESLDFAHGCYIYPACYRMHSANYYVVGAYDTSYSNRNGTVTDYLPGKHQRGLFGPFLTGTSQSTARMSELLLKEMK